MLKVFALFDEEGFPVQFWLSDLFPDDEDGSRNAAVAPHASEISFEDWREFVDHQGFRRWQDGGVVPFDPPAAPTPPILLFRADLWRRTTEEEAEQIEAAMNSQSARLRNLFNSAQTYQSDDPLWPVLREAAVTLFGEERADQLLAPSA